MEKYNFRMKAIKHILRGNFVSERYDRFIQNTHAYYWSVSVLGIVLTILFSYMVKKNMFPVCSILLRKLNV